jgi:hypothetical protein
MPVLRWRAAVLVLLLGAAAAPVVRAQVPAQDCRAAPSTVAVGSVPVTFQKGYRENTGPQEKVCELGFATDKWLCFVAPQSGVVTASLCETAPSALSTGDFLLSVYRNCSCDALFAYKGLGNPPPGTPGEMLACNDVDPFGCQGKGGSPDGARVNIAVQAGESYLIRLGSYFIPDVDEVGELELTLQTSGTNDECDGARVPPNVVDLATLFPAPQVGQKQTRAVDFARNTRTTRITPPPSSACGGATQYHDSWYCFRNSPGAQPIIWHVDTCSAGTAADTVITVYQVPSGSICNNCSALEAAPQQFVVACDDDNYKCGTGAHVQFALAPGRDALVRVGTYFGDLGAETGGEIQIFPFFWVPPPSRNDLCMNAEVLKNRPSAVGFDFRGASRDNADLCGSSDVWYCYEADFDGVLEIDACGSMSAAGATNTSIAFIDDGCNCAQHAAAPNSV